MTAPSSPPLHLAHPSRQQEQLRRFLNPNSPRSSSLPLLLPLPKHLQNDAAWVKVDLYAQLLLAQGLRMAIVPWYSKLTSDRDLIEEVVNVVRHGLQSTKVALLQKSKTSDGSPGSTTRIERFVLEDVATLVRIHYIEVRRSLGMVGGRLVEGDQSASEAATIFLASNPHPALSLDTHSQVQIDEGYIDLLLLAILQALLPADHADAQTEALIVIDVIKGIVRGQLRVKGRGSWVLVRALLHGLDSLQIHSTTQAEVSPACHDQSGTKWYDRTNLLLGLNFIVAVLQTFFLYLGVVYLDLFTPAAVEPKKRSKRRRGETSDEPIGRRSSSGWNLEPTLDLVVEALEWRRRILTRVMEEWARIGLVWGGSRLVERQAKKLLLQWAQPEYLIGQMERLVGLLVTLQDQPPPEAAQEPTRAVQRQEYKALVDKLLRLAQLSTPLALLLGHDEAWQRQSIQRAISPFLDPASELGHASLTEVANAKTVLALLERFAALLNPSLDE